MTPGGEFGGSDGAGNGRSDPGIPCNSSDGKRLGCAGVACSVGNGWTNMNNLVAAHFVLAAILGGGWVLEAAESGPIRETSHTATLATDESAGALADAWVRGKGWREGWDSQDRRLVAIGIASIPSPPSSPDFLDRRQAGFAKAFADARSRVAEFLAAAVEAEMESRSSIVEVVGDPEIAEALTGAAADEAFLAGDSFRDFVRVAANATLVGCTPVQTFVTSDGASAEVAVVLAWGPRYAAVVRGGATDGSPGRPLSEWLASIPDDDLAVTWGHRFVTDERGRLRPVSFGLKRARAGFESQMFNVAEERAHGHLGRLQGERLASDSAMESMSASLEGTDLPERFVATSSYASFIESRSSINGLGLETVGRRVVTDPLSGQALVVVAVSVVPDSDPTNGRAGAVSGTPASDVGDKPAAAANVSCPPVEERMQPYVRQVRANGAGSTREDAVTRALYDAIRQEGARIVGDSRLEERFAEAMESIDGEISEKVSASTDSSVNTETYANGFIHSYEVIGVRTVAGLQEVEICANVVRFDPKNPRFGLPPTVAVLPFAFGLRGFEIDGRPVDPRPFADDVEESLDRRLGACGCLQVLDERNDAALQAVRNRIREKATQGRVPPFELVKFGQELTADFVLSGELDRIEVFDQDAPTPGSKRAEAALDMRLTNVADGTIVWTDTAQVILKGRDLALARAGRGITDEIERSLSPAELAVFRAAQQIEASLQTYLDGLKAAEETSAALSEPVVVRVSLGQVTFEAPVGIAPGDRFAVENTVTVTLVNGRTAEDVDRVAIVKVVSVRGPLAKADVVDGDADLIEVNKSRLVRIPTP